jgi:hypothetical protein
LSGFSFIPTFSALGFNENIQSGISRSLTFVAYSYQLYVLLDRQFWNSSYAPYKNFFSVNCGIGFWPDGKGMIDSARTDDYGVTKSGKILTGSDYVLRSIHSFKIIGLAGGRYHIKNKIGKEVLILEMQLNYAINQYFSYDIYYKLNGIDQKDRLPEKGFSLQFLLVTRIAAFGRKK